MKNILYEEFEKVQILSGTVVKAEIFARSINPALKVWVDFGSEVGVLGTSSQIAVNYAPEDLVGKGFIGCVNLGEKNVAGFKSQFLLLGFHDDKGAIRLATFDQGVPNGKKLA